MSSDLISRSAVIDGINELMESPYANSPQFGSERKETMDMVKRMCVESLPIVNDMNIIIKQFEEKILEIKEQLMQIHEEDVAVRLRCKMCGLDEGIGIIKALMQ